MSKIKYVYYTRILVLNEKGGPTKIAVPGGPTECITKEHYRGNKSFYL